jgi:hypothetical protein
MLIVGNIGNGCLSLYRMYIEPKHARMCEATKARKILLAIRVVLKLPVILYNSSCELCIEVSVIKVFGLTAICGI